MPKLTQRAEDWLRERGISREVWEARPYEDFVDAETTRALFPLDELAVNQVADLSKMVNWMAASGTGKRTNDDPGGIIIHRVAPPGFAPITPELKTWKPLPRRPLGPHYHGLPVDGAVEFEGKSLKDFQIWDPDSPQAVAHITGKYHGGINDPKPHIHPREAKYRFLASPVADGYYRHTHEKMLARLAEAGSKSFVHHLLKEHTERVPPFDEEHEHRFPLKDKNAGVASRIDLHPLALERIESTERVYCGIEGCPKADSILSYILKHSRNESVFSFPSVGQWDPPGGELDLFAAEFLAGKQIIVVPDADWATKWQVERQALLFRQRLRRLGLAALIAAPPPEWAEADRKGVDDWLAAGRSLDDLVVIGREPSPYLPFWVAESSERRIDGTMRDAEILEDMSVHADADGKLNVSRASIAGMRDIETTLVSRSVSRLVDRGALTVMAGKTEVVRDWFSGEDRWQEVPEIRIADERLRPSESTGRALHQVGSDEGTVVLTAETRRRAAQERITDAIVDSQETVYVTPAEFSEMQKSGQLAALAGDIPKPGTQGWRQMIADTIRRADRWLDGKVRDADLAEGWDLTPKRVGQIRRVKELPRRAIRIIEGGPPKDFP